MVNRLLIGYEIFDTKPSVLLGVDTVGKSCAYGNR
jgi:hypothetical protein